MLSWIKKLFGNNDNADDGMGMLRVDLRSGHEIQLQQQGTRPLLNKKDERTANQLVLASHKKDLDLVKQIGRQLNDEGGLDRMKLICYRADNIGGDTRWIEMMWSGIGEWLG
jgi:hypothetical protein